MESGTAVRYLKVHCTSEGTEQPHGLGQSALDDDTAAKNNTARSSHLRRYEALIVHGDKASTGRTKESRLRPEPFTHLGTGAQHAELLTQIITDR